MAYPDYVLNVHQAVRQNQSVTGSEILPVTFQEDSSHSGRAEARPYRENP